MLASESARADWVPPFKGNDTGGIIAYSLATQADARQLAVDHCARYGKVVKFLAVGRSEGGYISFACRWVPYGARRGRCARATETRFRNAKITQISAGSAIHDAKACFCFRFSALPAGAVAGWRRPRDGSAGAQGRPVGNEDAAHRLASCPK